MVKVKCIECGTIGYTASPNLTRCLCGGRLREVVQDEEEALAGVEGEADALNYGKI